MMFAIALVLLLTPSLAQRKSDPAHPRWMVGDWCYPQGRPLRLREGDAYDGDEISTFTADGRWSELGESGRWRIEGTTLIMRRDHAESWALGKGERVRSTEVIRFVRHGRYAIEVSGARNGWIVHCP